MKNSYSNLFLALSISALWIASSSANPVRVPQDAQDFYDDVQEGSLAVVHFNPFEIADEESEMGDMKKDFKQLERDPRYVRADVRFIGVPLADMPELKDEFDLGNESTIILFRNGKPFKKDGVTAKKTGYLSLRTMKRFVEDNFGDYIDRALERRRVQQRPVERRASRVYYEQPASSYTYTVPTTTRYYTAPSYSYSEPAYSSYYYPSSYGYSYSPYDYYDYGYYPYGYGYDYSPYVGVGVGTSGFGFGFGF